MFRLKVLEVVIGGRAMFLDTAMMHPTMTGAAGDQDALHVAMSSGDLCGHRIQQWRGLQLSA